MHGDRHWLHTDPERAATSRFGGPIAHGFLTMALLADFSTQLFDLEGAELIVNYGLDRVRFPAPVPVGSRCGPLPCCSTRRRWPRVPASPSATRSNAMP